jgi:sensor domain CHASE-containing protein
MMQLMIGIVGFVIWTFIVFYAPELQNSEYLKFVQGAVVVVVGLALRDTTQAKVEQEVQDRVKDEIKTKEGEVQS